MASPERPPKMSPGIAKCPSEDKIAPDREALAYGFSRACEKTRIVPAFYWLVFCFKYAEFNYTSNWASHSIGASSFSSVK